MDTNLISALNQGLNQTLYPGHREIRVKGWEAAQKYPMPRDCELIMIDADPKSDHIYMKVTDSNGGESFERYKITPDPIPKFEPGKYVTTNEMNSFKEEILNAINTIKQSVVSTNTERANRSNGSPKQSGRPNNEFRGSETDVQSSGQ